MKFKDIPYHRPDLAGVADQLRSLIEGIRGAKSYEELRDLYVAFDASQGETDDMITIAHIRNTINTADPFYEEEMRYINGEMPRLALLEKEAGEALLASPFADDFSREFGDIMMKNIQAQQRLSNESVVEDKVRESELQQQYSKVSAGCTTVFRGETCNFYGLLKHMQSTDRAERKEAFEAWAALYESVSGKLDAIYDEMIEVRCRMAEKLGFKNYTEMAYLQRHRFDYNAEDVANFRRQVREVIVPACQKLYERQRQNLGIDTLYYYDESLVYPEGNAIPQGSRDELVAAAQKMYRELSPETGEFFDKMVEDEMFDLETKPGKRGGGYCTSLAGRKMPFIFSNFNGTSADVDVLTHEAGHAFAFYTSCRTQPLSGLTHTTSEIAEIHSMSMEHWTYPWMKYFFGDATEKYLYAHLSSALMTVPYLVSVDEFQHRVFENPTMSAAERRAVWHEIETIYLPWRNYDGNKFLEEGGFWMQKQHVFLYPFYYVDYALAQMGAFEFYGRMKNDRENAWKDYYKLCQTGGSKGYFDTLKLANLSCPLKEGAVAKAVAGVLDELKV